MLHKYCNCKKTFFTKLLLIPEEIKTELSTFNTYSSAGKAAAVPSQYFEQYSWAVVLLSCSFSLQLTRGQLRLIYCLMKS